jgi:hypothetical protein
MTARSGWAKCRIKSTNASSGDALAQGAECSAT